MMTYVELVNQAISAGYRIQHGESRACPNCIKMAIVFKNKNGNKILACPCGARRRIND